MDPEAQPGLGSEAATVEHDRSVARRRPQLAWTDAAGAHAFALVGRVLLGSAPDAGLVVADRTVSRVHAELEARDDGLWVRDLGSRNGSFVDEVRIECGRVPPGGTLRVGGLALTVTYEPTGQPLELWSSERFGPLLGRSTPMRELFARLSRIAPTDSSVLVQGETGTGKELVARAVHDASPRARQPYVVVDCAALPENLVDAELFGHEKGAFTGAHAARAGAIEAADGGTLFLDEIGELPLSVQPRLLRVLEAREYKRLGETQPRPVDLRIVSATHRDLGKMVNAGAFREDLYFRLAVLVVKVVPLRERSDDIPLLVRHLLGADHPALTPSLLRELADKPWLGNVRELRNFVERLRALGSQEALATLASPGLAASPVTPRAQGPTGDPVPFDRPYKDVREDLLEYLEREYFRRLLAKHGRNVPAVAQEAGVDRTYVYRLIRKHDL